MLGNQTQDSVKTKENVSSNVTLPISKPSNTTDLKQTNAFVEWLNDKDTVKENNGKISKKTAATSYAKGLIEVVKTVYKQPVASAVMIAVGVGLTLAVKTTALIGIMSLSVAAGVFGLAYAIQAIRKPISSAATKEAWEVLGISTFILGVGVYGLLL